MKPFVFPPRKAWIDEPGSSRGRTRTDSAEERFARIEVDEEGQGPGSIMEPRPGAHSTGSSSSSGGSYSGGGGHSGSGSGSGSNIVLPGIRHILQQSMANDHMQEQQQQQQQPAARHQQRQLHFPPLPSASPGRSAVTATHLRHGAAHSWSGHEGYGNNASNNSPSNSPSVAAEPPAPPPPPPTASSIRDTRRGLRGQAYPPSARMHHEFVFPRGQREAMPVPPLLPSPGAPAAPGGPSRFSESPNLPQLPLPPEGGFPPYVISQQSHARKTAGGRRRPSSSGSGSGSSAGVSSPPLTFPRRRLASDESLRMGGVADRVPRRGSDASSRPDPRIVGHRSAGSDGLDLLASASQAIAEARDAASSAGPSSSSQGAGAWEDEPADKRQRTSDSSAARRRHTFVDRDPPSSPIRRSNSSGSSYGTQRPAARHQNMVPSHVYPDRATPKPTHHRLGSVESSPNTPVAHLSASGGGRMPAPYDSRDVYATSLPSMSSSTSVSSWGSDHYHHRADSMGLDRWSSNSSGVSPPTRATSLEGGHDQQRTYAALPAPNKSSLHRAATIHGTWQSANSSNASLDRQARMMEQMHLTDSDHLAYQSPHAKFIALDSTGAPPVLPPPSGIRWQGQPMYHGVAPGAMSSMQGWSPSARTTQLPPPPGVFPSGVPEPMMPPMATSSHGYHPHQHGHSHSLQIKPRISMDSVAHAHARYHSVGQAQELEVLHPPEHGSLREYDPSSTPTRDVKKAAPGHIAPKYECQFCGKRFTRPSSLKIHLHVHTGEKPYVCDIPGCGRSFSVQSNLRRHQKAHHSQNSDSGEGSEALNHPTASTSPPPTYPSAAHTSSSGPAMHVDAA